MRHVLVGGAAVAAALLMVGAVPRSVEALPVSELQVNADGGVTLVGRRGGHRGGGHHGGRHRGGGHHAHRGGRHHRGGHHGRRHRGLSFYSSFPYFYGGYYYGGYYDDDCAWLRRKALRTNSRYWWRRYHRCRDSY
ncbi:MAG TPA: hypothetical protein VGA65_07135 [Hyphomicrobium sp.]